VILVKQGDITGEEVQVIVNAANSGLRGGGGVDGAIHRAGGPSIMAECRKIGSCPTGSAVITNGGSLKAAKVIHAVGPVWYGGKRNEPKLLEGCYAKSFELAKGSGLQTIAFPAISTGVYGYPIGPAARIALCVGKRFDRDFREIRYVCFSQHDTEVYQSVWNELKG